MEHAAFEVPALEAGAMSAVVLLDPLSRTAQRVAPMLGFLRETLGLGIKVHLEHFHWVNLKFNFLGYRLGCGILAATVSGSLSMLNNTVVPKFSVFSW